MSFKKSGLWPCNPNTARGQTTKLGFHKSKLVYANGRSIIIRDVEDPGKTISYVGHVQPTTVARISPSGYYCASADVTGNVRIWDTVGEENILKGEYRVLGGRIDLSWDGESKRIIAVGDGKDKFAHAFMMDTGSSCGDVIGHNKIVNAVAIRHQRPFRAVTASDDRTLSFHTGVPFKYDKQISTHSNFVVSLAYASSGDLFASSGADYKVFVYDGKTGEVKYELESPHKGSVNSVAWSPDNRTLLTSSGDCTVKLWDVESHKSISSYALGSGVAHQQVGNAWLNGSSPDAGIVSLSVSGDINIFDRRVSDKPIKILHGIQKAVTTSTLSSSGTYLAGSADGRIVAFDDHTSGEAVPLSGELHTNYISGIGSSSSSIYSVGYDDRVRKLAEDAKTHILSGGVVTSTQPKGVALFGTRAYVLEANGIEVFEDTQKVLSKSLSFEATAIAVSADGAVAVGSQDSKVYIYDIELKVDKGKLENSRSSITALAFSPDSKYLVAGDTSGKLILYNVAEMKMITGRWSYHTARINSLAWTGDSLHVASGSLDTDIYVWSVEKPLKTLPIKNAVAGGVNAVSWLRSGSGKGLIAGAGADPTIRLWEVTFHA